MCIECVCVCVVVFVFSRAAKKRLSNAHLIKSSLQLFHGSTPWADVQYVCVHAVIEHTCSPDILFILTHLKLFWHFKTGWIDANSQFNVRHRSLEWQSTASSQVCRGWGVKCSTPLPRRWKQSAAHFLGDAWRWGAVRRTDQAWAVRDQIGSGGGPCVPTVWGGSVGGVSPAKLRFPFTPSAASPHYWPLHRHLRSRCTLKDGGRLGGPRQTGRWTQARNYNSLHSSKVRPWLERADWLKVIWRCLTAAMQRHIQGTRVRIVRVASEYKVGGKKTGVRWKVQASFTVDWFQNRWR